MLDERLLEAADRVVPGPWEGNLILGLGSSATLPLVERTTRFTPLSHLPRLPNHGVKARVKSSPAMAGHGAQAVCEAITRAVATLPDHLRRSLTWNQGAETSQHAGLRQRTGVNVYFCEPESPWQLGTNKNTNGLLRQYFPKDTDPCLHGADDFAAVAATLNARPRKVLGWRISDEIFERVLFMLLLRRRLESTLGTSSEYRQVLEHPEALQSMSREGECWNTAVLESFFSTLKPELDLAKGTGEPH